jgi:glycosyl hydrolase family 123
MRIGTCSALAATLFAAALARAGPNAWVIDDGEKIRRDATATDFEQGVDNPVWHPGESVRLFAMRNESVALQVVVEADRAPIDAATVDLARLSGPDGAAIVDGAAESDRTRHRGAIERFVEHFIVVRRASGGRTPGESLGWEKGAAPPPQAWVGPVPDALIPVEFASSSKEYPMRIQPNTNGIVWIDLHVSAGQPPGPYRGRIEVHDGPRALAEIPVDLEVADARLPDRTASTMLFYDRYELAKRAGPGAERHLWKLLHAHRIAPLHDVTSPEDVFRQRDALDGTLYTPERGYEGPAMGLGDGVLSVGAYGALGPPDDRALVRASAIADAIAGANLFEGNDVFLYAADEQCASPWGGGWRSRLQASSDANARLLRVGWTCSEDPTSQPVDIAIVQAAYEMGRARAAYGLGKSVWVYNGVLPRTGTFLLDADAVSPRVNGWLSAMYDVPRWFYWESVHWYGQRGAEPLDPFVEPETLRNRDGDWANGDGLLVYPGAQLDRFQEHSFGFEGVFPSIRLKNWRRGIEDAGYVQLARARDPARAGAVTHSLIPSAFGSAVGESPPSWSARGASFFEARRALLEIALGNSPGADRPYATAPSGERNSGRRRVRNVSAMALALVAAAFGLFRLRRWSRPR